MGIRSGCVCGIPRRRPRDEQGHVADSLIERRVVGLDDDAAPAHGASSERIALHHHGTPFVHGDQPADTVGFVLITLDVPADGVVVVIDEVRLSQVVENLLTNAIKYTDVGEVTLRLLPFDAANGMVRFAVQDTGTGMSAQDLPLIFAPYERARAKAYSRESAGVGLAVVQTLLAHMGGKVAVASVVGGGSTFTVEIVAARAEEGIAPSQQRRVLIVDDREDVLSGLSELVEELGFKTDRASSAGAASNLLAARSYDTAMFDLQMPVTSGAELATEIRRSDGPNRSTPFIAMSAGEMTEEGRAWPFDQFVRMPVSIRTLKRSLGERSASLERT